jgi:tetratricopeptide (TPR) repeat protein
MKVTITALALLITAVAVGGYYAYCEWQLPKVPAITSDGLDPEVVEVIDKARRGVEAEPRSADAWGELGLVLFAHAMYPEATPCFEQAEAIDAEDARWPYYLALIHILGDREKAFPALDRAVQKAGANFAPRLRRAETLLSFERWDEARTAFDDLLLRNPNNPRVHLGLGLIATNQGRYDDALQNLLPLVNEPTCQRTARTTLAGIYDRRREYEQAEIHRRAIESLPKDASWPDPYLEAQEQRKAGLMFRIQRCERLMAAKKFEEALAQLKQLAQSHPKSDEVHLNLGRVYLSVGDPNSAERALRDAIRVSPEYVTAHFLLGAALFQQGRIPDAEAAFRKAIEIKSDDALCHFNLGHCRRRQQDAKGALECYRMAIRYRPNLIEARLAAAELLLETGDKASARGYLEEALLLQPENEKAKQLLKSATESSKGM